MHDIRPALLLAVLVCSFSAAHAQQQPTTEQRARELLVLMRAGETALQVADQMIATMKEIHPDAPEEFWTGFRSRVTSSDLVEMLVPVYARHLTREDLEELIRFYSTPTGQRFLAKQPVIVQESMSIGQKWGEKIAGEALEELRKRVENPKG